MRLFIQLLDVFIYLLTEFICYFPVYIGHLKQLTCRITVYYILYILSSFETKSISDIPASPAVSIKTQEKSPSPRNNKLLSKVLQQMLKCQRAGLLFHLATPAYANPGLYPLSSSRRRLRRVQCQVAVCTVFSL